MSTVVVRTTSQTVVLRSGIDVAGSGLPDVGTDGQVLTVVLGEWVPADPSAGSGAVDSVNTKTGIVFLDAADVGAATPAEVATAVSDHSAVTVGVHGIADTSALETTTGAQAKADAAIVSAAAAEFVRDTIGTALTAGTGITVTVNDGADTITLLVDTVTEAERIDDRVAALLVAGTNVTLVYDDVANTLTINATGGGGGVPDPHAVSHQDGGSDELALDGSQITSGTVADARIPATITRDTELTDAVTAAVTALLDGAPGALDTLNELAAALGDDANFATTVTNALALKAVDSTVVHLGGNETITGQKTVTGSKGIILVRSDAANGGQFRLYGTSDQTGLTAATNGTSPKFLAKLIAGDPAYVNDVLHDWQHALQVSTYLANGAGISAGSAGAGDAIFAQNDDTGHEQLTSAGRPYAVNVFAGRQGTTGVYSSVGTGVTYSATGLTDPSAAFPTTQGGLAGRWVVTPDVSNPATAVRGYVLSNDANTLTLNALGWVTKDASDVVAQTNVGVTPPANGTAYVLPLSNATAYHAKVFGDGNGLFINRPAGAGTGSELILLSDSAGVDGALFAIYHDTADFVGNGIDLDLGNGAAGSFAGNFFSFKNRGSEKMYGAADGSFGTRNLIQLVGTSGTATQTTRWKGCTTTGSPTGATFATGDWVTTNDGHIWICTAGGPPGTWVDVGGGGGGSGDVATDTIWDAIGDLVVGTGADTGGRLAIGTAGQFLKVVSGTPGWVTLAQSDVGGLVAALADKAPLASPTFTGIPVFPPAVITLANQVNAAANSIRGNNTGSAGVPLDLTAAQVKTLLNVAQSDVAGLVAALAAKALQTDLDAHTADTADAHDASAISILDTANDFTATDVEGALAELQSDAEADATALSDHVADTTDAHDASAISFTPNGSIAATDVQTAIQEVRDEAGGGGAPTDAGYLVTAAHAGLSAELAVGATPNGELGGTWDAITVDATHSGSSHAAVQAAAEGTAATALSDHVAAADPHPGYTTAAELAAATFNASAITAGTMATARLGSGTANGAVVLKGDSTWGPPPSDPLLQIVLRQQFK